MLSLARNAIGAQDAPSGLVITGLALVLTFFVMAPVAAGHGARGSVAGHFRAERAERAELPELRRHGDRLAGARRISPAARCRRASGLAPLRTFLAKHSGPKDRATFVDLARKLGHGDVRGDELWVLAPAFIATELRQAFEMAILIFIPFLVIDLVVALGLASLGLAATSPQVVALPLKLLLFVAIDGWRLLLDSLLRGYA